MYTVPCSVATAKCGTAPRFAANLDQTFIAAHILQYGDIPLEYAQAYGCVKNESDLLE